MCRYNVSFDFVSSAELEETFFVEADQANPIASNSLALSLGDHYICAV